MRHPVRNLIFAGLLFLASGGLLSASGESNVEHAVETVLRENVQAGVTDAAQVIDRFGEPATREPRRGPGASEVLGYNHDAVVPPRFPLLPLIALPIAAPAAPVDTFFEVTDGVVTRYWTSM